MAEPRDDLEIPVADQRRNDAAMHGLPVWQKSPSALGWRTLMRRQIEKFLRRGAVVERVDHVRPGHLVKSGDKLGELFRMLAAQIRGFREILGVQVQRPIVKVDGFTA